MMINHTNSPSPPAYFKAKKIKDFPSLPVQRNAIAHHTYTVLLAQPSVSDGDFKAQKTFKPEVMHMCFTVS